MKSNTKKLENSQSQSEKVFDAHIHYLFDIPLPKTIDIFEREFAETATKKGCFLSIPHETTEGNKSIYYDDMQNIKALVLKRAFSPDFYAFAGLVHPQDYSDEKAVADSFARQVEKFAMVGYDGMKMLEGYPSLLKLRKVPLDSKIYDKYYSFIEESGMPITMHIANPAENWDITKASKHAIESGRVYDGTYPTKSEITEQTFNVLKKHPKLSLALAHCGFFSYDISQAEYFMGEFENTILDITPGGEQLINMSLDWDRWLKFFEKYQDRIIYGSDYYAFPDEDEEEWRTCFTRRPRFLRQFFETDSEHLYVDRSFKGINLDPKLRKKLYWDNSMRIFGEPKKVSTSYIRQEAEKLIGKEHHSKYAEEDLKYIIENV